MSRDITKAWTRIHLIIIYVLSERTHLWLRSIYLDNWMLCNGYPIQLGAKVDLQTLNINIIRPLQMNTQTSRQPRTCCIEISPLLCTGDWQKTQYSDPLVQYITTSSATSSTFHWLNPLYSQVLKTNNSNCFYGRQVVYDIYGSEKKMYKYTRTIHTNINVYRWLDFLLSGWFYPSPGRMPSTLNATHKQTYRSLKHFAIQWYWMCNGVFASQFNNDIHTTHTFA